MKILRNSKFVLVALLLTSIVCGSVLGSGVALAADTYKVLSVGWNYITGYQDETIWGYNVIAREYLNGAKTAVTFDYIYYYNGWGDPAWDPYFQETYVYDEHANDWVEYWDFWGEDVQGINKICNPSPNFVMDTISPSNEYALVQQLVKAVGTRTSDYVIGWVQY